MNKLTLLIKRVAATREGKIFLVLSSIILLVWAGFALNGAPKENNVQENIIIVKDKPDQSASGDSSFVGKTLKKDDPTLGQLKSVSKVNDNLQSYKFSGKLSFDPIEIITSNSDNVVAILQPSFDLQADGLNKMITDKKLGDPSFEMYLLGDYRVKVYVFLSQGVAYEASEFGGNIFHEIHFQSTNKEGFISMFPNRYSATYVPPKF